jgi:hypothetical protein
MTRFLPKASSPAQAVTAVAAAALFVVAVAQSSGDKRGSPRVAPAPLSSTVSLSELTAVVRQAGQTVYWVGPRAGSAYALTRNGGQVLLRYVPVGAPVAGSQPFVSVGTRPLAGAFAATRALAAQPGSASQGIPGGGIAVNQPAAPTTVYLAYPRVGYQLEITSPSPGQSRGLLTNGSLEPVPGSTAAPGSKRTAPAAFSVAQLSALSVLLGRPVYWVGQQPGTTYELARKGNELFLRYLPPGVPVGSSQLELTVGTYRVPDAYTVTANAAAQPGAARVEVGNGAVAFYRRSRPQSIYLAFPGQDIQVEVYDPDAAAALQRATSGRLGSVG